MAVMKRKVFLAALGSSFFARALAKVNLPFIGAACKTQRDQEGPFYKQNAPERAVIEKNGIPLLIEGTIIKSADCKTPVANAIIDIWHCDNSGEYDNNGFKCRGIVKTDAAGRYSFTTIYPPSYGNRPRHIHVKVRAPGFDELTTQIYFKGDPHIKNDFARNAEDSRVIELRGNDSNKRGRFDVYL
jgi:catechol 1,2-dioxygenase